MDKSYIYKSTSNYSEQLKSFKTDNCTKRATLYQLSHASLFVFIFLKRTLNDYVIRAHILTNTYQQITLRLIYKNTNQYT